MEKGLHGKNEKKFNELSYADQAKSINGQIRNLEKSILYHLKIGGTEGKDVTASKKKYIDQLKKLISNL